MCVHIDIIYIYIYIKLISNYCILPFTYILFLSFSFFFLLHIKPKKTEIYCKIKNYINNVCVATTLHIYTTTTTYYLYM